MTQQVRNWTFLDFKKFNWNFISADFADQCLDALSKSDKLKYDHELSQNYGQIVECGHEFAKIYDFDDSEIIPLREKFEETDELTWSKFEQLMDETCGGTFDVKATSLFLVSFRRILTQTTVKLNNGSKVLILKSAGK